LSDERTALFAALACSLHPLLIWYTARIWIETTNTLLVSLVAYTIVLLFEKKITGHAIVCGIATGFAILTKSVLLFFPLIVIVLLMKDRKENFRLAAVLVVTILLIVAPWTLRNYKVSHAFVPVHVSLGLNLIQGDALATYWETQPLSSLQLWYKGKAMMDSILGGSKLTPTDVKGDRLLTSASFRYNAARPLFLFKRTLLNFLTFWYLGESPIKSIFLIILQVPLFILTVIASARFWKASPFLQPLILLIGYYALLHSLIIGWARYSVPIIPLCIILSVMFLQKKKQKIATEYF